MSEQSSLAKEGTSIFDVIQPSFEDAYPCDIYNDRKKSQPPSATFYERLRNLRDSDRVLVKSASKPIIRYIDEKCQFEVLDKDGEPIFFALDTTDAWASTVFEGTKPFNVMILDYDYAEVLKITGPGLSRMHGYAWVKNSGKVIGRIAHEDQLCSFCPTYSLEGDDGQVILKAKGPPSSYSTGLPNEPVFDVLLPDDTSLMGRIEKRILVFGKESEAATPEDSYVISFHPNMDLRTKCLMLSIVFMLDYQYYHKTVKGGVSRKCWIWFSILFFSLVVFILVAVDVIKKSNLTSSDTLFNVSSTAAPYTSESADVLYDSASR